MFHLGLSESAVFIFTQAKLKEKTQVPKQMLKEAKRLNYIVVTIGCSCCSALWVLFSSVQNETLMYLSCFL